MSTVLYTMVDAQCDKLVTAVGQTKLTAISTVDALWQIFFLISEFGTKLMGKYTITYRNN